MDRKALVHLLRQIPVIMYICRYPRVRTSFVLKDDVFFQGKKMGQGSDEIDLGSEAVKIGYVRRVPRIKLNSQSNV
jgi:hypothetical protein